MCRDIWRALASFEFAYIRCCLFAIFDSLDVIAQFGSLNLLRSASKITCFYVPIITVIAHVQRCVLKAFMEVIKLGQKVFVGSLVCCLGKNRILLNLLVICLCDTGVVCAQLPFSVVSCTD